MASSIAELLEAILAGTAAPQREGECTACMGTVRFKFFQAPDDPRRVRGEARCIHCHEEAETEDRPLQDAIRKILLKAEGTWTLRVKGRSAKTLAAAREALKEAGLTSVGQPPGFEGTLAEMQFLAERLRARKVGIALARSER